MTSTELYRNVEQYYNAKPGAWALVSEVPNATSNSKTRSIDALAMGLWQSVGIRLHAMELKVSRSDWTREIEEPEKAAAFSCFVDHFWLVAPSDVFKLEEVPADWGVMVPHGETLRVKRAAAKLNPEPITRPFLAGIMRAVTRPTPAEVEIERKVHSAYLRGRDEMRKELDKRTPKDPAADSSYLVSELNRCKRELETIRQLTGVDCGMWGYQEQQTVRAVRSLLASCNGSTVRKLQGIADEAAALAKLVEEFDRTKREPVATADDFVI